jgi:prevent-host-death family protein
MTMKMVNMADAKAQLSELVDLASTGERIVICKRNEPVAEIRPIAGRRATPRPLGLSQGSATLLPGFFEPLPDDVLAAFEGTEREPDGPSAWRVADSHTAYGPTRRSRKRR